METKWQKITSKIWFAYYDKLIIRVYKDDDGWNIDFPQGLVVTKPNLKEAKKYVEEYIKGNGL